jgi:hypothetical protein
MDREINAMQSEAEDCRVFNWAKNETERGKSWNEKE